ncbi:ParA family protein [Salinibaculum rarum]|uniref:ParA family protein n=1 Tax=Salinibaculum rarum TaxID=3058903 RepID=UPI00265D8285|nr:ParA family protein [Salinibaculum sp. KK48]
MAQGLKRAATFWTDAGGVGKTTITSNVGDILGSRGNDVLCIDLDPQHGGLTKFVGMEHLRTADEYNLLDVVFSDDRDLNDIIVPGDHPEINLGYDLIPSHRDLEDFAREITAKYDGNPLMVIRRLITEAKLDKQYDYILVDVQGSRAQLVANAIVSTRNVVAPIELSEKGAGSIEELESYIERQQKSLNRELKAMGAGPASLGIIGVIPYGLSHGTGNFATLQNTEKDGLYSLHLKQKPVTPFGIPEAKAVSESLSNKVTLREFIERDDTRDLRDSSCEQVILQRYKALADLIEAGEINDLDGPYTAESVFRGYNGSLKNKEREEEILPDHLTDSTDNAQPHSAD